MSPPPASHRPDTTPRRKKRPRPLPHVNARNLAIEKKRREQMNDNFVVTTTPPTRTAPKKKKIISFPNTFLFTGPGPSRPLAGSHPATHQGAHCPRNHCAPAQPPGAVRRDRARDSGAARGPGASAAARGGGAGGVPDRGPAAGGESVEERRRDGDVEGCTRGAGAQGWQHGTRWVGGR